MRVLLVNPPYSAGERYGKDLGRFGPLNEPLGLAYIAAVLERAGHEVCILDAPALDISSQDIPPLIRDRHYRVMGVTMLTPMYRRSTEVIRTVREAFPDMVIVVGGAHPTILPEETLESNPEIDFAVLGEGEEVMAALVQALEKGEDPSGIAGLASRKQGRVHINPPRPLIGDLDDLPMPARHLLPMDAYRMTRSRSRSSHAFTVSVARGCPFDCAFCCRIFGRKVRHHSVGRIVEEIRTLVDTYGAKEINLEADTLTLNKSFLLSLCDGLVRSGLIGRIIWTCESRVDTVNADLLRRMKEAGCWQISYGVETGTQRLLDLIHKGITLEQIRRTFALTKRIGIGIRAFYMLGIPTETREESLRTISFARDLDAQWSQFTLFTPFPGTDLYRVALQEGGLRSRDWSDFKTHGGWTEGGLAYVPKGRTLAEMKDLQKKAYRAVYMRPRVILRFLKNVDSIQKLMVYASGLWVLIKTALPQRSRAATKSETRNSKFETNNNDQNPNDPNKLKAKTRKTPKESSRKCTLVAQGGWKKKGAVRIKRTDLRRFAEGVYVDSPVYFAANPLVRWLNWKKLDAAFALLPPGEKHRALDFCCGNGVLLQTLSRRFRETLGIDLHPAAAARVKRRYGLGNVFLLGADGRSLPLRNELFSVAFALSALEHFRDPAQAVNEIARVLQPGGSLIFLSPTENGFYRLGRRMLGYSRPADHYHSGKEIEKTLEEVLLPVQTGYFPWQALPWLAMYRVGRYQKKAQGTRCKVQGDEKRIEERASVEP
ncbi:MAG: cobalamin-dependent protein [Thermodesulfobacteriota bacterium]